MTFYDKWRYYLCISVALYGCQYMQCPKSIHNFYHFVKYVAQNILKRQKNEVPTFANKQLET